MRPFHDLRVTSITNDAIAGVDPVALMTKAGHASMKTTRRYLRLAGVVFREEADALEQRLLGGLSTASSTDLRSPDVISADPASLSDAGWASADTALGEPAPLTSGRSHAGLRAKCLRGANQPLARASARYDSSFRRRVDVLPRAILVTVPGAGSRYPAPGPLVLGLEALRELGDDPGAEHVGHAERLYVDVIVGRDVPRPITVQARQYLRGGRIEMVP